MSSMAFKIWLRVNLPEEYFIARSIDPEWLSEVEGVFTEDPCPTRWSSNAQIALVPRHPRWHEHLSHAGG